RIWIGCRASAARRSAAATSSAVAGAAVHRGSGTVSFFHRGSGTVCINVNVWRAGSNGSRPRVENLRRRKTVPDPLWKTETVPDPLWKSDGSQTFGQAGGFDGMLT